jgi:hypothetical protein
VGQAQLLPLRHDPPFKHYIAIELVEKADPPSEA